MKKVYITVLLGCFNLMNAYSQTCTIDLTSAIGTDAQTVCSNNPITDIQYSFGGGSATIIGLPNGITGSVTTSGNPGIYSISGTSSTEGTYNYTVSTNGACTTQDTITGSITVNGCAPVLSSSLDLGTVCSGQISYTPTSITAGATFSWSRATVPGITETGASGTSGFSETLTNTTTSPIQVTYVYTTSASGTSNSGENVIVMVSPETAPIVTVNSVTICEGLSGTLTASGATSYSWSEGTANSSITMNPTTTTSYTVTGTTGGCSSIAVGYIYINTLLSTSNITKTCNPNGIDYTVEFDISGGDMGTYVVTGDLGSFTSATHFISNPITSGSNYSFTVDDAIGCTPLTLNGNQSCTCITEGQITGGGTICSGNSSTINITLLGTAPWDFIYAIDGTDQPPVTGITSSPYSFTTSIAGVYTLISVKDANCQGATSGTATIQKITTTATISGGGTVCQGDSVNIQFNFIGTAPWSFVYAIDGVDQPTITSNFTTKTLATHREGIYTITTIQDANCAGTTSGSATVVVNNSPTITNTATPSSAAVCLGDSVSLRGSGGITYTWTGGINDGEPFVPTSTTSYTVTGTNSSGCVGTSSRVITVFPLPTIGIVTTPSAIICSGDSVTLSGTGGSTYTWSGGILDGQAFSPVATTSYTLTGQDKYKCYNTATVDIIVQSTCNPQQLKLKVKPVDASNSGICDGNAIANVTGGVAPYTFTYGGNTYTGATLSIDSLCVGFYTVSVTDAKSDSSSFTFVISAPTTTFVNPTPTLIDSTVVDTLINNAFSDCDINYDLINAITISDFSLIAFDTVNLIWTVSHGTDSTQITQKYHFDFPGVHTAILQLFCTNRATGIAKGVEKIYISGTTGIEALEPNNVLVYPNPFDSKITIVVDEKSSFLITDISGSKVFSGKINSGCNSVNTGILSAGAYFVTVINTKGTSTKKIIKN